jgi:citrate synthase
MSEHSAEAEKTTDLTTGSGPDGTATPQDSITVTDNRTGRSIELPMEYGTHPETSICVPTLALREIKRSDGEFGILGYDPAFQNTASCRSAITYIDGDKGILRYRGYPIEQLAENSCYLEVAYLLLRGELPSQNELEIWRDDVTQHALLHENVKKIMDAFWHNAHPMGIFVATIAALSTYYPDSKNIFDRDVRMVNIERLIGKVPAIAAYSYRHSLGLPYIYPDQSLTYTGNFLAMLFNAVDGRRYEPDPALERAMDVLFILHADHEQNCSTTTMRVVGSSQADPFVAVSSAASALYGPLHGGANEAVLRMLDEIGDVTRVPEYVDKAKQGDYRLMGFGHRVYKYHDPRATLIKKLAYDVFNVVGLNPKLDVALELERCALEDDYFIERKLYPNVDFYSGLIYQALNMPVGMFPVLFAIGRTVGWLAHWQEMVMDPEQKIARPRQIYTGETEREYVPLDNR